jgi:hypothetical protein
LVSIAATALIGDTLNADEKLAGWKELVKVEGGRLPPKPLLADMTLNLYKYLDGVTEVSSNKSSTLTAISEEESANTKATPPGTVNRILEGMAYPAVLEVAKKISPVAKPPCLRSISQLDTKSSRAIDAALSVRAANRDKLILERTSSASFSSKTAPYARPLISRSLNTLPDFRLASGTKPLKTERRRTSVPRTSPAVTLSLSITADSYRNCERGGLSRPGN